MDLTVIIAALCCLVAAAAWGLTKAKAVARRAGIQPTQQPPKPAFRAKHVAPRTSVSDSPLAGHTPAFPVSLEASGVPRHTGSSSAPLASHPDAEGYETKTVRHCLSSEDFASTSTNAATATSEAGACDKPDSLMSTATEVHDAHTHPRGACCGELPASILALPKPTSTSQGATLDRHALLSEEEASQLRSLVGGVMMPEPTLQQTRQVLASVRSGLYKSKLTARRVKMCLKTNTDVGLDALPSGLATEFQTALCSTVHPGLSLLDMSVRRGCVMISLDLVEPAGQWGSPDITQHADDLLQALMPQLQPLLTNKRGQGALKHGHCYVVAQFEQCVLRVLWDQPQGRFILVPTGPAVPGAQTPPVNPGVGWALGPTRQVRDGVTAAAAGPGGKGKVPGGFVTPLRIQVWCLAQGSHNPVAAPPLVTGGVVLPAGAHETGAAWGPEEGGGVGAELPARTHTSRSELRLWVRCGGAFVSSAVTVLQVVGSKAVVLQVDVDAEQLAALQLYHHVGGKPLGALPVTLELWQGERWLSSRPVLLQTALLHPAPTAPTSILQRVSRYLLVPAEPELWWWGAGQDTMQQAVRELHQLCDASTLLQLQLSTLHPQEAGDPTAVRDAQVLGSQQEFVDDLLLWLDQVRVLSVCGGAGCSAGGSSVSATARRPATVIHQPALSGEELREVAHHLLEYSREMGLRGVSTLITEQVRSVGLEEAAAVDRVDDGAASGDRGAMGQLVAFSQALRVSAVGAPCAACEQSYRGRLSQQLAGVQGVSSLAFMLMGLVANLSSVWSDRSWDNLAMLPWGVLHLGVVLAHWAPRLRQRGRSRGAGAGRRHRHRQRCSWWCVASYLVRWAVEVGMAVRVLPLLAATREQFTRGDWVLATLVLSLGEQMQASALVPAALCTCVFAVEAVTSSVLYLMSVRGGSLVVAGLVGLSVLLPRLLLDMQMRVLLGPRAQAGASGGTPAGKKTE